MLETAALTVRDVLRLAAAELAEAGCEQPRLDAELLLCEALGDGWSRSRLVTSGPQAVDSVSIARFEELVARRRAREPVAYILGRKDFRRISLAVDRRVLIPRPETELLVEVGLTLRASARVADVGTGSGAVALALKDERSDLQVTGIDASAGALALARENAARLGLDVMFVQADLLDDREYDAVLANLPYVPLDAPDLPPELLLYEPAGALFAGPNGLEVIDRLIARLASVPLVALEVGMGQAPPVADDLERARFAEIEVLKDLAGHRRVVVGRR